MRNALFLLTALMAVSVAFASSKTRAEDKAEVKPTTQPTVKKISLNEFEKMRKEKDAVVLDVRTPREFEAGHVPGAVNIPWAASDFNQQVSKLDKSKTYLVHCYRGTRSAAASKEMLNLEFTHLFDFAGGYDAYQKAKKTIEK